MDSTKSTPSTRTSSINRTEHTDANGNVKPIRHHRRRRRFSLQEGPKSTSKAKAFGEPVTDAEDAEQLKAIHEACARILARVSHHEEMIALLRHDIEAKIEQREMMLHEIKDSDEKASNLAVEVQAALRSIQADTKPQLKRFENLIDKENERVSKSEEKLEEAQNTLRISEQLTDELQQKLVAEEAMLARIDAVYRFIKRISYTFLALLLALVIAIRQHRPAE